MVPTTNLSYFWLVPATNLSNFYWYLQPIFPTWYRQLFTSWDLGKNHLAGEQLSVPLKCRKNWLSVPVKNKKS